MCVTPQPQPTPADRFQPRTSNSAELQTAPMDAASTRPAHDRVSRIPRPRSSFSLFFILRRLSGREDGNYLAIRLPHRAIDTYESTGAGMGGAANQRWMAEVSPPLAGYYSRWERKWRLPNLRIMLTIMHDCLASFPFLPTCPAAEVWALLATHFYIVLFVRAADASGVRGVERCVGSHRYSPPFQLRGGSVHQRPDLAAFINRVQGGEMARVGEDESEWDVWAYNDAIKKTATFQQCMTLFDHLESAEVVPNVVTYHGLLDSALRGNTSDATKACEIFERIPKSLRNHHTYASAIRLYAVLGRGGTTTRLLAEGKLHNVAPDPEMIAASMEAQVTLTPACSLCLPHLRCIHTLHTRSKQPIFMHSFTCTTGLQRVWGSL